MSYNEADLLKRARRLDEEALGAAYDAYSNELYYYGFRLLGQDQAAEDLVADTFCRLLLTLQGGGGPRKNLRAYLYRVAHNLAMDYHRRKPIVQDPIESLGGSAEDDPALEVERAITREAATKALWHLTPDQRQVILLKFFQGLSNEEVSKAVDKPIGAVKSLQHRALDSLRRVLVKQGYCREMS